MSTPPNRPYPDGDLNVGGPNECTVELFAASGCRRYAEIGVYRGDTAERIAQVLGGEGEIHLFDYADRVEPVAARLRAAGHGNVCAHGNSRRLLDSYNWSLMAVLAEHPDPAFDYVFIDGAHTWAHDALAFVLADRLLVRGGYIDFDDYGWTLASSPSMNPVAFPEVEALYTNEQIATRQVALVVDLLVRRDERYEEVVADKVFRKR
jgi:predicted O-methyltransferase YrrM